MTFINNDIKIDIFVFPIPYTALYMLHSGLLNENKDGNSAQVDVVR